jgi:hypothetical protein
MATSGSFQVSRIPDHLHVAQEQLCLDAANARKSWQVKINIEGNRYIKIHKYNFVS